MIILNMSTLVFSNFIEDLQYSNDLIHPKI